MSQTTILLIVFLIMAIAFFIGVMLGFASAFNEDQVKICSFVDNCFIVNADQFLNKTQNKIVDKIFNDINKIDYLSEADALDCYLDPKMKQVYCMEVADEK